METNNLLKIIIIDYDVMLHDTYRLYFKNYPNYVLKGFYTNVQDAIEDYSNTLPDIIISEVSNDIFEKNGIAYFKSINPDIKFIMISMEKDFEIIKKAFKNGASGYLTKPIYKERIHNALISIQKEGAAISNDIAKQLILMFQRKSHAIFSKRENQIIDYLLEGATYKTIAKKLFVTASAVNFHIQNIYVKLNVNSKSEALSRLQEIG